VALARAVTGTLRPGAPIDSDLAPMRVSTCSQLAEAACLSLYAADIKATLP
jgi:hypothetical protein